MSIEDAIKRVHRRVDKIVEDIKNHSVIIRGNGDGNIGLRGRMIEMSGRLDNVEQHIKDQKVWVRAIALLVLAQIIVSIVK